MALEPQAAGREPFCLAMSRKSCYGSISLDEYLSRQRDWQLIEELVDILGPDFRISSDAHGLVATMRHLSMRFRFLPGGSYQIGFSESEEAAARELTQSLNATVESMRPVNFQQIRPLLVAETPISNAIASHWLKVDHDEPNHVAVLTRNEADTISGHAGCRLPHEREWEAAIRAGTKSLFPFGDVLPNDTELAKWLNWNIKPRKSLKRNALGLAGLFFGEWCVDRYRDSYATKDPVKGRVYVVRGGGAVFWPWQDEEWVWCMSAMRMPSTELFSDRRCAARLVYDLPATD